MVLAQVGHQEPTLEWLLARSDLVVRASVAEVSKELLPKEPFSPDRAWAIVTLKVHETFKGRPPETLRIAEWSSASDRRHEDWRDAGRELLVFLLWNPSYQPGERKVEARFPFTRHYFVGGVFRLGPVIPQENGWSWLPATLFRNNLDVLETPAEILEATRRLVAAGSGAFGEIREHELSLPRRVMEWSGRAGDVNHLYVPVDPQLETLAREFILSPAEVLSKRGNSAAKRAREQWWDGYWVGRMHAAKNEDDRRQVRVERDRRDRLERDELRVGGVQALVYFKSDKNVALLASLLNDESISVVVAAAKAMVSERLREAASALVKRLKDKDASVRMHAAHGLGEIGAKESAPELVELLKDEDPVVRRVVAGVLGEKLKAKEAAPELVKLLKDGDPSVRSEAAEGLRRVGSKADAAALLKVLHDEHADVRRNAVRALGDLGAMEGVPDLVRLLDDPHLQTTVAWALAALGAREAIPGLLRMLRGESGEDQVFAARMLGFMLRRQPTVAVQRFLLDGC